MSDFVHLHCHTEYSLLDGAIRLKDLGARAKDYGMTAAAITDHGNLFGAAYFYTTCKSFGIKPIIGCEVYVAATDRTDKTSEFARTRYHLVLLAQNNEGYHNLVRLVTRGFTEGFHYKPRVDKELLREYSDGLIALSACLAGEVPRVLMKQGMDAGIATAQEYASIFPGRFYLELQSNGIKEQEVLNEKLIELAGHTNLPLVATNDCHYLDATDVEAHDILLCIQTQTTVDDPKRMRFETRELYYKSPEEMEKAFAHVPEAIANTGRIAEMCNIEMSFGKYFFPVYELPEGMTLDTEFQRLAEEGLKKRLEKHPDRDTIDHKAYWDRLEWELKVITDMGFPGYFLIVQDFINWAKNNGIPVGPGRGSAAGSLVAWSLRITNLDPIPYDLLFERFLNNERVSMPDIDVDFCERRRTEVIRYVAEKYGEDSVSQITTFGKMKAKAVVRDVGRALGMSFGETDRIAKLIPEDLKMTIKKALEAEPDLATLYRDDPQIRKLLDVSMRLEGLSRHASTHAAGVVISDKPMSEYLPLYKGKKGETVTQFDMKMVEKVGLVKFDFLGLRTMTLVQDALDEITRQGKTPPDLDTLSLDDAETYELYSRGDTDGVFQVESSGMRQYLRMLRPTCFDDIIAMLALYRPGPLGSGMVDEFIKRKHGEVPVTYPVPSLEACLQPTYGVIVYQEQVMQIAQIVGSYTLGGADLLRRAMGKKIAEAMAEERTKFVQGAQKNDIPKEKANEIFDLMEKFAEYGFNKSHSAAYALISYYTAFLKVHFPVEFMAALLTSEMGNQDKLLKYVAACKDMDIEVLRPNVQVSRREFTVHEGRIVFGLGGIKNVGDEAIREIVDAREEGGPYASLLDMCVRVNLRKVTKRVIENLIKGGACDCLGCTRAGMLASLDTVVARAQKKLKERDSNQVSLFTMIKEEPKVCPGIGFDCEEQTAPEWPDDQKLRFEKEALGFFLTSHPLQPYRKELFRLRLTPLEEARDMPPGAEIRTAVLVTTLKELMTKKGQRMAFAGVEDLTASAEVVFFPEPFAEARELLKSDQPLLLEGTLDKKADDGNGGQGQGGDDEEAAPRDIKIMGAKVMPLAMACCSSDEPVIVELDTRRMSADYLAGLRAILEKHKGTVPVNVHMVVDESLCLLQLGPRWTVQPGPVFENDLNKWTHGGM
ncbi:DNA polymerase III subunit alpha [Nitratidesulfovibrio vulgaris]|uniref:DNA polymerase III subunit alpha n=2 Tax=Nitratidesulfovibrio vulgaris TaxID=881 RepID=Q72CD0_NITV2|nr:DNA polymerase III subunit alpha [Nitratidesulfovibrio vulgaris]AAS95831.1 DNA polymerase III, alpha subunit [Nitratidesulfovibrio vulgaris str. Hildenborough]ADP86409.1 DNA polymerase III, alpha subunit [Nitratidesulfovibrio vulgaris RCH1]WCB47901.1 DNA polymerase III subunit alpha [Nitratidesulfovibrio vulgaris]GEB79096.1 DNA-directed DNA polymerase [Desulfovibrio desulfuricans]